MVHKDKLNLGMQHCLMHLTFRLENLAGNCMCSSAFPVQVLWWSQ